MTTASLLHGERVRLRALEPEDLELLYTIENDPALWMFGAHHTPYSRYALKQYIAESAFDLYRDGQLRLIIERTDRASAEAIGLVDLFDFEAQHRRAEVGIALLCAHRAQGLGAEALRLLADYARVELQLHQILAYVACDNDASLRAFQSAGFQSVATLSEWFCRQGDYVDAKILCRKL